MKMQMFLSDEQDAETGRNAHLLRPRTVNEQRKLIRRNYKLWKTQILENKLTSSKNIS